LGRYGKGGNMLVSTDKWELPKQIKSDNVEIILSDGRRINIYEDRIEAYNDFKDTEIITKMDDLFNDGDSYVQK
jgi:hypothetical protein